MPSLMLRDIPDELLQRLRTAAEQDGRSLADQALVLIERGLTAREDAAARAERRIATVRVLAASWESDESTEDEVRAIYESRTPGRDFDH